jgi:ketose-bisphosphate aldolase
LKKLMTLVKFADLMEHAEREEYAVGYFECWNLESLMAVADAAEATRSPVLLGFSGIYIKHPSRLRRDPLSAFAALGLEVCRQISVPAALVFNECSNLDLVLEAIDQGFSLVMFSDESLPLEKQTANTQQVVKSAHQKGAAVEGEALTLPGLSGNLHEKPEHVQLTDVEVACDFVERTGVDAFAVNVGQMHLHGRQHVGLDLVRLHKLKEALQVPLVLHGASSVYSEQLARAVKCGIRKINVGSILKQAFFDSLREACADIGTMYNPYEVIGSGLEKDVLMVGRVALQDKVEQLMRLFGSAGKAG